MMEIVKSSDCFGDSKMFPPGFRFHPTDEELVLYYLKRKICKKRHRLDVIGETDVYKWDPEELPGISKLKTGDRLWFFFSPRDRKYPHGARSSRATSHGYWKATGKDRVITCGDRSVGLKKTLVFYQGRAPNGGRTDWVMHEYTMDEKELQRCPSAKDYYALYKVYKKSGPGPKNGEQYGAPFREEEWDNDVEVQCPVEKENTVKQVNEVVPSANNEVILHCGQQPVVDDLEEILNRIADDDSLFVQPLAVENAYSLDFFGVQPSNVQARTQFTQSGTTQLQLSSEASEVTSTTNVTGKAPHVPEDVFFEDFLELNDLCGPEQPGKDVDDLEKLHFAGFNESDLYQDVSNFLLDELEPSESGQISQLSASNFNEFTHIVSTSGYINNFQNNNVDYHLQPQFNNANGFGSQLWSNEQIYAVDGNQGIINSSTPGAIHQSQMGEFVNHPTVANENGSGKQDDTNSWISSSLWSFVESIPTNPASASESAALVNKTFLRMSSFSRVRLNAINMNVTAGNSNSAASKRSGKSISGFLCLSLLGVMCALLWMFCGTSVR